MTTDEIVAVLLKAAELMDERDFSDPVEAVLAAQGYETPAAHTSLARKAQHLIRKQDNVVARMVANLGGGQLLTNEQMADLTPADWEGVDFDTNVCPDSARGEAAWWLRWCALDVRWAARMDVLEVAA